MTPALRVVGAIRVGYTPVGFLTALDGPSIVNRETEIQTSQPRRDTPDMAERSYRWLLITLAMVGLAADQTSKYGVFRWLYNGGMGDHREVVTGSFRLIAQFDPSVPPCDCALSGLQTWSGP